MGTGAHRVTASVAGVANVGCASIAVITVRRLGAFLHIQGDMLK